MSDIKFACPSCQQHIQCEPAYAGMEIPCPACHAKMVVPAPAGAAAPPPPPPRPQASGLRVSAAAPEAATATVEAPAAAGTTCPSCGNPVAPRAIMCIKCGTNLRTGQKMTLPGGRPGVRPMAAASGPVVWYKNPNVYAGTVIGIFVACYGLAWITPLGTLAYVGFWFLMVIASAILVLIDAFQDSVGTGFLTMCVPFYVFYFVYVKCDNKLVKAVYSLMLLSRLGFWILPTHNLDQ